MTSTASRLIFGFIAGALATLIVHQGVVFILGQAGMLPAGGAWATRPYGPLQVPTILNQMFWGGLWGSLFAFVGDRLPGPRPWLNGLLFGLLGPLLFNWIVMAAIRGQPLFAGLVPARMLPGILILGAFGIGIAVFYNLLTRRRIA